MQANGEAPRQRVESESLKRRIQEGRKTRNRRRKTMNRYVPPTPRAALGLAAAAVTAIMFGVAVVAPAKLDSVNAGDRSLAVSTTTEPTQVEVVVIPMVEIVATREPNVVSAQGRDMIRTKSKQQI
jgi:hypothetical protein